MKSQKLTKRVIDAVAPNDRDCIIWDSDLGGLRSSRASRWFEDIHRSISRWWRPGRPNAAIHDRAPWRANGLMRHDWKARKVLLAAAQGHIEPETEKPSAAR